MRSPVSKIVRHVSWTNINHEYNASSGYLDYYDVSENIKLDFASTWGVAHVDYWKDPVFFQKVAGFVQKEAGKD